MTIREAAELWVRRDIIPAPVTVVEKLFTISGGDDINEITPPAIHDRVLYPVDGEIINVAADETGEAKYLVKTDEGGNQWYTTDEIGVEHDDMLPMWGTMWAFADGLDKEWLESPEHLQAMADCGFRIYESEDYGYLFGIDGAGYDFYENHWIPLYKAIGLQWHDKEV